MFPTTEPIDSSPSTIEPALTAKLPPRYMLGLPHVLLVLVLAALAIAVNHLPLRGTDLWTHVIWGQWIAEHHALPAADPVMWAAEGMPVVDTCWLAQVALAAVQSCGDAWLRTLFAGLLLATYIVLARTLWRETPSVGWAACGVVAAIAIGWSRLATIRPEAFGGLLFALVLWLVGRAGRAFDDARRAPGLLIAAAVLFALWANLHGSFVCGLAVLTAVWLGHAIDVLRATGSIGAALADAGSRRRLWLLEVAVLATLVNPYGIDLWLETLRFSANPNLRDLVEWYPLSVAGAGGVEFGLSLAVLAFLLRHSRRPMPAADVLLLALFALLTVLHVRMIGWYALVYVWTMLPHAADIAARFQAERSSRARRMPARSAPRGIAARLAGLWQGRSWRWSLVCATIAWIGWALSDAARPLVGGKEPSARQLYGPDAPLAATAYLQAHPPAGTTLAPQAWADWLVLRGPGGLRPLVTSNVHLVPRRLWQDYLQVVQALPGWQQTLLRYGVRTVVVDKQSQPLLAGVLRRAGEWKIVHEDPQALIARHKTAGAASARTLATNPNPSTDLGEQP